MLANYTIINIFNIIDDSCLGNIFLAFNTTKFVIYYILLTLIVSAFVALLSNVLNPIMISLVNFIRKQEGKNILDSAPSLLACLDDGKHHLLSIEQDGEIIKSGLFNKAEIIDGTVKGIFLTCEEIFDDLDLNQLKDFIKGRYYNVFRDNRTLIEYDIDNIYSKINVPIKKWRRIILWVTTFILFFGLLFGAYFLYKFLL